MIEKKNVPNYKKQEKSKKMLAKIPQIQKMK